MSEENVEIVRRYFEEVFSRDLKDVQARVAEFWEPVIYSTSRLARDVYLASLYHRELQAVGVQIHYATGGGDADTPEGKIFLVIQQALRSVRARQTLA